MIIFCYTSTHDVLCYFNEWVINKLQKYKKIILYKGCKKNIYKKGSFIFTFPRKLDKKLSGECKITRVCLFLK